MLGGSAGGAMYLFFDTETSGLPKDRDAPPSDVDKWPHAVQVGWILCKPDGSVEEERDYIVKPDGWTVSDSAAKVHGITTERALAEGVPVAPVLGEFAVAVQRADTVVAHNLEFDRKVMKAELIRAGISTGGVRPKLVCTMTQSTDFCAIPGKYGNKWPTLEELHQHLFEEPVSGAHSALADTQACMRCFFRLRELGVLA